MNTESTHRLGSLKRLAIPAILAGGLGLAVMGLGAGTANARGPEIICPTEVPAGNPSTASLGGWSGATTVTVWLDAPLGSSQGVLARVPVDEPMAAPTTEYWDLSVPALPAGPHKLIAQAVVNPGTGVLESAFCHFYVT